MNSEQRPLEQQLMSQFHHLSRRIGRAQRTARGMDLMRGQGRVLRSLHREDGIPQQELARRVRIQPASASELISKMEQKGHVERKVDTADRRRYLIYITPEGRAAAEHIQKARAQVSDQVFSALTPEEQKELSRLLTKVSDSMENND